MDINKEKYDFNDLVEIIKILRSPEGCPWDKVQTHETLKSNLIEESYEFLSEVDSKNIDGMKEELGDVLLQVVMHAQISNDDKEFNINDVIDGIAKKMIFRHPHVFKSEKAENVENAYDIFKQQKEKEKHFTKQVDVLKSIPESYPALMKSQKIISKIYKMYPEFAKINEERIKVEEISEKDNLTEEELGEILFNIVTLGKQNHVDCEIALSKYNQKIVNKFEEIENEFIEQNQDILTLETEKIIKMLKN